MSIMEQNNIEEQVCDAIGILVNEGVESAGYDKTISAQIVECVDTLKGKYKIKYQDAYYYATSDNIEVEYTKNTQVYILVPGNDFSREKKIIGTVKDLGDAYVSTWNAENEYVMVGRNCAEIVAEEPLGLCSYKSKKYTLEELILYKKGASDNKLKIETTELKKYLEDSEKLRIGATFQTALADEQRQRGNYGISVKADFKDADNTGAIISKTFNLDVNSMIGMPYGFEIPSAQYLDFDIKGSNFIEITQVALLIADFPVEKDNYPEDIFISNFVIEGLAKPDAKVFTTYYLNITSSTGKYLTETDSKTTLEAILSLKNKTVTSSSLEYYWFIEDASVVTTHDLYCVYGGQGWRCLNNQKTITEEITKPNGETEKQERKEWVPGTATREVSRENIPNIKSIYKCVCIYNSGKSSIAAEIELENTSPTYKFEMSSVNGTEFILDRGKTTLKFLDTTKAEDRQDNSLVYHWAKTDASGGYHYLGGDNSGNGGELPVCDKFDNSSLMKYLRQLSLNYAKYLGNKLVKTKSVYSEYSTFNKEDSVEAEKSVLREGFKDFGLNDVDTAKVISDIILVLKLDGPTNEELANAIQPYLDSVSITWIDEFTFYDVPARSILSYNIFKCTAMKTNGEVLGTARIQLNNKHVANDNGYIIVENGNQTFKYSAEGVAPTDKNNKNPLTVKPLTFKLFDEAGNEVSGIKDEDISWYYPLENTLIKVEGSESDLKTTDEKWGIRHGQTFIFDIESRFKYEAPNDVIKIEVKHQDRVLKQDTSFSFIKDGMSGTNGTDYFCRIVPRYDLDNAYPTLVYNSALGNESPLFLNKPEYTLEDNGDWFIVELWNGSELVTSSDLSATFKILFPAASIPTEGYFSLIEIQNNKFSFNRNNISKLTTLDTIKNNSYGKEEEEKRKQYENGLLNIIRAEVEYQGKKYFAELPLAVAIIEVNEGEDIDYGIYVKTGTGYNEVVYAADGARPQYASAYPFEAQVIRYENGEELDLSTTLANETYKTPFIYNWDYTLGRFRQINYNLKNNEFLTVTKLQEAAKDAEGNEIKNENGTVQMVDIEGPARKVVPSPYYNGGSTDLGVKCIVRKSDNTLLGTLYFPIHFMLNKFGYSALNDWDGTSVEINEDKGYILSPQIGAGKKDTNNRFTGVLMGEMKSGHEADSDIGLLGFHEGVRTIFLDAETGKAEFGKTGAGQIILDPTSDKAQIYSGNYYSDTGEANTGEGMLIDFTTPKIEFGSGAFKVSPTGILTARGADVRGPISSSSVNIYGNGYSDFEQIPPYTKNRVDNKNNALPDINEIYYGQSGIKTSGDVTIDSSISHSGNKSLKIVNNNTTSGTNTFFTLGCEKRNYGKIEVKRRADTDKETVYIISAWVRPSKKANLAITVGECSYANRNNSTINFTDDNRKIFENLKAEEWQRVYFEYIPDYVNPDSESTTTYYIALRLSNRTIGSTIYVDDIQIEESYTKLEPSDYHPTGVTKIDGGTITTETITALGRVTAGEFYIGKKDKTLFQVNSDGYLYAQGAKFEGHIESGSGEIGGWNITPTRIWREYTKDNKTYYNSFNIHATESGNAKPWASAICIGSTNKGSTVFGTATSADRANFVVSHDGILQARGANITGAITATSGTIGKCSIDKDGNLQVPAANITGTLTIGQVDGAVGEDQVTKITEKTIKTTEVTASKLQLSGSIDLGSGKFTVSNTGVVTATSGTIGGWHLGTKRLYSCNGTDIDASTRLVCLYNYDYSDMHRAFTVWSRSSTSTSWSGDDHIKFSVNYNGKVYASNAEITGDSSFGGELKAVSGTFTSLTAANSKFTGSQIKIDTKGSSNKGAIYIGDPEDSGWKHITIAPTATGGIGNIGTDSRPFDVVVCYVCKELSDRSLKENIQYYNINQAYEELKNLPIYTFNYLNKDYSKLGTMIDYIPSEVMAENVESNLLSFDLSSLSFWNIAATQVIQQKLEETIQEKEELQNRLDILEQKFLEMEEKLNGFN